MAENKPTSTRLRLLRACYAFMQPVARFLLRSGISFTEFSEVSRAAFVEVASDDYGIRGRPTNISRIAAMTGIGRKEVRRLKLLKQAYEESPQVELSPLSDVLHNWFTHPDYLTESGHPMPLPFRGGEISFEGLVKRCAGDIPAGAVKVELVRCGSISEDSQGKIHALRRQVIPADLDERLETALVFSLRGLASTIAFNTSTKDLGARGRIERFFLSDGLTEDSIKALHPILRERIRSFADGIDDFVSKAERSEIGSGKRIGVGVFYYQDD